MTAIQAAWRDRPELVSALVVLTIALLATLTGLGNDFTYDDIPIIVENPMVQEWRAPWEYFADSYWGPARGNSLYRPLTIMAYALQRLVGGGGALPFHIVNITLYAAMALAVLVLARELLPAGAALLAAALFAAHPVHVEAVANVVGQAEMLAGIPLVLAVVLYLRARTHGTLGGRTIAAIVALMALALLSKEHGIILPGLLVAAELAFRGRRFRDDAGTARALALLARAIGLLVISYFVVRYAVLGGLLGDESHPAIRGFGVGERSLVMLGVLPEVARLLAWPARLYADYSPQSLAVLPTWGVGHLPGAAILAAYLVALVAAWRRDRTGVALFALLWLPVTYALVSNVLFASGVIIAERTLLLPSLAVTLLAGWVAARVAPALGAGARRPLRTAVAAVVGTVLLLAVVHSAQRQMVWEDNPTLFATMVVDAPDNFRAHHALGEMFGSAGVWDRAQHHLGIADSLFPGYDLLQLSLARVAHFDNRCPQAVPLYEEVLRQRPEADIASVGRAACLVEMRHLQAARAAAVDGLAAGRATQAFRVVKQVAESSLVATDTVDARNRWWREGKPFAKSDARLTMPILLMRPSKYQMRRRMPESVP